MMSSSNSRERKIDSFKSSVLFGMVCLNFFLLNFGNVKILLFQTLTDTFVSLFCLSSCQHFCHFAHWSAEFESGRWRSVTGLLVTAVCGWFSSHFVMWHLSLSPARFCAQTLGLVLLAARHTVTTQWNITRSLWDRAQPNLRRLCPGNDCDDHRVRSRCRSLCCHRYFLPDMEELQHTIWE